MPSGVVKLPPHANPHLRKIHTTRQSMVGTPPIGFVAVFMSSAMPQVCRDRFPPVGPPSERTARGAKQPPYRLVLVTSMAPARPAAAISLSAPWMAGTIVLWQVATIGMPAKAVRTRLACRHAGSMLTFPPPVGMYQNCPSLAFVVARSRVSSGVVPPCPG